MSAADNAITRVGSEIAEAALGPLRAKFADLASVAFSVIHPTLREAVEAAKRESAWLRGIVE